MSFIFSIKVYQNIAIATLLFVTSIPKNCCLLWTHFQAYLKKKLLFSIRCQQAAHSRLLDGTNGTVLVLTRFFNIKQNPEQMIITFGYFLVQQSFRSYLILLFVLSHIKNKLIIITAKMFNLASYLKLILVFSLEK